MPKPLPQAPPAPPGTLAAALAAVPDPRHPIGWRPDRTPLPLVGVLQLAVAAMLCGARSLYAVAQWGRERIEDDPAALVRLGLPPGRSPSRGHAAPGLQAALDVAAFERVLGEWLAGSGVEPADALALDGKTLRGIHGDAVPGVHLVARLRPPGRGGPRPGAEPGQRAGVGGGPGVLDQVPLAGRVVTGDALLTQRAVCQRVVAGRGTICCRSTTTNPPCLAAGRGGLFPRGRRPSPDGWGAPTRAAGSWRT